jgi:hypothetical protein
MPVSDNLIVNLQGMWARSLLHLVLGVVTSSNLYVPTPYSRTPPSFPLLNESEHYAWSSTMPEVIQVKPDMEGCRISAVRVWTILTFT